MAYYPYFDFDEFFLPDDEDVISIVSNEYDIESFMYADDCNCMFINPSGVNIISDDYFCSDEALHSLVLASSNCQKTKSNHKALAKKMGHLFNDESSSDIILQVNGKKFYAHRLILSSWSTVFYTMIGDPKWTTPSTFSVTYEDKPVLKLCEDVDNFKEFLEFLYKERVTTDIKGVWDLASLADKYNVTDLTNACNVCLIDHIRFLPVGEELVKARIAAQNRNLTDLCNTAWQKVLDNIYFFSKTLLPVMDENQLCEALESSNLIAEDEYQLLQKLLPRLHKLEEDGKGEVVQKLLNRIRFSQMSAIQLQDVLKSDFFKPVKSKVTDALFHRCSLWDQQPYQSQFKGPRLYLQPPPPFLKKCNDKIVFQDSSFTKRGKTSWKYFLQLKLTPRSQSSKSTPYEISTGWQEYVSNLDEDESQACFTIKHAVHYSCDRFFFLKENDNSFQWTLSPRNVPLYDVHQRNGRLYFHAAKSANTSTTGDIGLAEATIIVVVHAAPRSNTESVLSQKVSIQVDLHSPSFQFNESHMFDSGINIPLTETKYVTFFAHVSGFIQNSKGDKNSSTSGQWTRSNLCQSPMPRIVIFI